MALVPRITIKSYRSLFAMALIVASAAWATTSLAIDTTIKCTCACTDSVGTWTQSCYSTADCTVCCSYKRKHSAGIRKTATPSLIETPNGFVEGKPLAPTQQRR